nr:MAG TPA: hypothetical protein [Caudoviricetes sp.]
MRKRIIRGNLSSKGIQSIIDQLQDYKQDLHLKAELLCKRLADAGLTVAQAKVGESPLGKTISLRIDMEPSKAGCKAMLIASGQTKSNDYGTVSTLLLVEFGAGVFYNPSDNPKAGEMGYGIGTFPGQIHAFEDGWYYWGEDEKWHYTHGVKATMPMYSASVAIREQVASIAKEVFS